MELDSYLEHACILDGVGDNDLFLVDLKAMTAILWSSSILPAASQSTRN